MAQISSGMPPMISVHFATKGTLLLGEEMAMAILKAK